MRAHSAADLQGTLVQGQHWSLPSSRGLLTPSMPMAYSSSSSGMLPSLPYLSSSPLLPSDRGLLLPSCFPNVLAQSRGLSHQTSITPACFWLVVVGKISNGGHLRPSSYFIFVIVFCRSIRRPEIRKTPPPYTPPWPRILSIIPPIAAANYWLIVAS